MKSRKLGPAERIEKVPGGNKRYHRRLIESLEVGEQCFIARSEWHWKRNGPPTLAHRVGKKLNRGFTHYLLVDNTGWIIERLPDVGPKAPDVEPKAPDVK